MNENLFFSAANASVTIQQDTGLFNPQSQHYVGHFPIIKHTVATDQNKPSQWCAGIPQHASYTSLRDDTFEASVAGLKRQKKSARMQGSRNTCIYHNAFYYLLKNTLWYRPICLVPLWKQVFDQEFFHHSTCMVLLWNLVAISMQIKRHKPKFTSVLALRIQHD